MCTTAAQRTFEATPISCWIHPHITPLETKRGNRCAEPEKHSHPRHMRAVSKRSTRAAARTYHLYSHTRALAHLCPTLLLGCSTRACMGWLVLQNTTNQPPCAYLAVMQERSRAQVLPMSHVPYPLRIQYTSGPPLLQRRSLRTPKVQALYSQHFPLLPNHTALTLRLVHSKRGRVD
jgi:hypothetical protein